MMSTARKQYQLFPEFDGRVLGYRQLQVLGLIRSDLAEMGNVRSYQQIAERLGMCSKIAVCNVIQRLERRGLIQRPRNGSSWEVGAP